MRGKNERKGSEKEKSKRESACKKKGKRARENKCVYKKKKEGKEEDGEGKRTSEKGIGSLKTVHFSESNVSNVTDSGVVFW